jgi:SAM-dependent methyltransferase
MTQEASFFTDGEAYDRQMGRWSRSAGEVFLDWLSMPRGLRWLDAGCGTGAFTKLILERSDPSLLCAIDPSERQIDYARATPWAREVTIRVGTAQSVPFESAEFDVIVMALVITFIPDPAAALLELKRVARPGGLIATYMWDLEGRGYTQQPLLDAFEEMNIDVPWLPGFINSRLDTMIELFNGAGLVEVEGRVIKIEVSYPSFDEFWLAQTGFANPIIQRVRGLSSPELEQFKSNLRRHLSPDRSGHIAYQARANAVRARVP